MAAAVAPSCDVVVIGSGPAGVAATFPLVEHGVSVLMIDGGVQPDIAPPRGAYADVRAHDDRQWEWMVGRRFTALREMNAMSPKFRAATLDYVFRQFAAANRIESHDFVAVGSLAAGGLSNAWGCGVARIAANEWEGLPFAEAELAPSYERVTRRIGVSGAAPDDMTAFFGIDGWAEPAVALDPLHDDVLRRYTRQQAWMRARRFRMGHARVAVLTADRADGRRACTRSGFCLWGCAEDALYSARHDLRALQRFPGFAYAGGAVVDRLERDGEHWSVRDSADRIVARARRVVLAAGTLATTRIALRTLGDLTTAPLLTLPAAAFALWLPRQLGAPRTAAPGFAQLAFALDEGRDAACGFTFSTHALPVAEFVRASPLMRRSSVRVFAALLSSTLVANCFLPGHHSANALRLAADGVLHVDGGMRPSLAAALLRTRSVLRAAFLRAHAIMLPGSFTQGSIGADAHYAGTLPMRAHPRRGETSADGEVEGLPGVLIADASALPSLPAKSHTLAMMACADRLGTHLARTCRGG